MDKQNNRELSRIFQYAGKYHGLTILGCVLSGIIRRFGFPSRLILCFFGIKTDF